MLVSLSREQTRAELIMVALGELRDIDERGFAKLVATLAQKWYGVGSALK